MTLEEKRNKRRKQTSEDFTPEWVISQMLDRFPPEIWEDESKTFIDNSAGNGNFLVYILQRKLEYGHNPLRALSTIYGVELMYDNVEEMHHRMYSIVKDLLHTQKDKDRAFKIIKANIVCHDALTWDYDNWCSPKKDRAVPLF